MTCGAHGGALKLSVSPKRRWRGRTVAVLLAAALPLAASESVAQAAPSAQARLTSVAKTSPEPQGRGDRAVQARPVRAHGPRARPLPPRPRRRTGSRPSTASPITLAAREARALRRSRHVLNVTLNTRVQHHRRRRRQRWRRPTRRPSARTSCGPPASPARASASPSSTPASAATCPDFKGADGSSRITANVIANPGATRPGDDVGHGTHVAGIIAGNSLQSRPRRPGTTAPTSASPPTPT